VAFALKPGRPVSDDVTRIVRKQLMLAARALRRRPRPSAHAVHEARRHIKKVRAVIRLLPPGPGCDGAAVNSRLRDTGRLLAPVADSAAVVDALSSLRRASSPGVDPHLLAQLRRSLVRRSRKAADGARADLVLARSAGLLDTERKRAAAWTLRGRGFRSIAPGLERTARRARKGMSRAAGRPTSDNYHAWRRRVKDLWLQVRVLERRCGNGLVRTERQLEELDGRLGEYHNVVLLERLLATERLASRAETAVLLRALRRLQLKLRRDALAAGEGIFEEHPEELVRRVHRLWQRAKRARADTEAPRWRRAA